MAPTNQSTKPAAKPAAPAKAPKAPARKKAVVPQVLPPGDLVRPTAATKFTLYNLLGQPQSYYRADPVGIQFDQTAKKTALAHHIIVVDRSGSMYSAIPDLRDTLVKLLTLDEYTDADLVVTLISYSSKGDVTCHFERAKVKDVMATGSSQRKAIASLQATCMTCISQGLKMAVDKVKPDEPTAITLHTDGYANDPSTYSELAALEAAAAALAGGSAYLNTLAYTDWSDFRLLAKLANLGGGAALKAGNVSLVYDALKQGMAALAGGVVKPLVIPNAPGATYQVVVSRTAKKVTGSNGSAIEVKGVTAADDCLVYRFTPLTKAAYAAEPAPQLQTSEAVYAFARAQLAEGNLNTAKYALASTCDMTFLQTHGRALTNPQVAAFAQALDQLVCAPAELATHTVMTEVPVNTRVALLSLVDTLALYKDHLLVNRLDLVRDYQRRGVRKLVGSRDEAGKLVEPTFKTEYVDKDDYLPVSSYDVNRNTATLNMLFTRKVTLVPAAGGAPVKEVAGIKLDKLTTFNNYTLVGDGELNVKQMTVRVTSKKLFDLLRKAGVLYAGSKVATAYSPTTAYVLRLDELPLVPPFAGAPNLGGVVAELVGLKILSSFCAAHLKGESSDFTPQQVDELKKHYLSTNLYLNFPTCNPYTDLKQALTDGLVDTRTSYRIDLGDKLVLNPGKLHSANKFLDRFYAVTRADGTEMEDPKFETVVAELPKAVKCARKQLSAKTKTTAVDLQMAAYYDELLGVHETKTAQRLLGSIGAELLTAVVKKRLKGSAVARKDLVEACEQAKKLADARADVIYADTVSPLVFYVGATGTLPDECAAPALTAEQLEKKYPEVTLSKGEREALFYELDGAILTVYATTEYFSRDTK